MNDSAPVLTYAQACAAGPSVVGGKAWNLARLARYGFPVPAGGVIVAGVYAELLTRPDVAAEADRLAAVTIEQLSEPETIAALQRFAEKLRSQTLAAETCVELERFLEAQGLSGARLAVRSSAVGEDSARASFAGIHESWLNVTDLQAVRQAVLDCYASLWTPRALVYRRRWNISDRQAACAVLICEMVAGPDGVPMSAGVAFTCDPRSGRRDVITINAAPGLGDVVVRGDVTPDEYVLVAHRPEVVELRVENRRPLLTDSQLAELGRLAWRVHWALGAGQDPQDIEWAHDGRRFWLLQARPVTNLPNRTFAALVGQPTVWSNANVKDSFPGPATMLTWSMMEMVVRDVLFASLNLVDYQVPSGMQVMRRHDDRFYFDLSLLQWAMYDAIGITPAETNRTMGGFQPEIAVPPGNPMRGLPGLKRSWRRLKMLRGLATFRRRLPAGIERMFAENRRAREIDLRHLDPAQLASEFHRRVKLGNELTPDIQLAAAYYGAWMTVLQDFLGRRTGDRQQSLLTRLLAGSGDVASAEQAYRLIDLAKLARAEPAAREAVASGDGWAWRSLADDSPFRRAFDAYLHDFGHRGVLEMEFSSPRWHRDPTYLVVQLAELLKTTTQVELRDHARQVREAAEQQLQRQGWLTRTVARWMLSKVRQGAALRENAKSAAAASVDLIQDALLEVGRRLATGGHLDTEQDVFHLALVDIDTYLRQEWSGVGARELVADRASHLATCREHAPPDVIVEGMPRTAPQLSNGPTDSREAAAWRGVAAAPGCAEGNSRVISSPELGTQLANGEVLVAPSTDPGWTPLFLRASAVVMETGGYLSHGAIVTREFGIPSVVNVSGIMTQCQTGDRLRVDGDRGEVVLLQGSRAAAEASAESLRAP